MTGRVQPETAREAAMLIDCDSCAVRDLACGDCGVTVLLGMPSTHSSEPDADRTEQADVPLTRVELDEPERAAIAVLAGQGLIPPLRLVPRERDDTTPPRAAAG